MSILFKDMDTRYDIAYFGCLSSSPCKKDKILSVYVKGVSHNSHCTVKGQTTHKYERQ